MNLEDILFYGMVGSADLLTCAIIWAYHDNSLLVQELIVVFWVVLILFVVGLVIYSRKRNDEIGGQQGNDRINS